MINWLQKNALWLLLGIVFLSLDLGAKWLAGIYLETPIEIISGFLQLSLTFNKGIAFSIPIPNMLMVIATPILLGLAVWLITSSCKIQNTITKISLALILSGGLGNFINRLVLGAVTDMIEFSFWPSFNLADTYLTIGTFLLIIFYGKIAITHGRTK